MNETQTKLTEKQLKITLNCIYIFIILIIGIITLGLFFITLFIITNILLRIICALATLIFGIVFYRAVSPEIYKKFIKDMRKEFKKSYNKQSIQQQKSENSNGTKIL